MLYPAAVLLVSSAVDMGKDLSCLNPFKFLKQKLFSVFICFLYILVNFSKILILYLLVVTLKFFLINNIIYTDDVYCSSLSIKELQDLMHTRSLQILMVLFLQIQRLNVYIFSKLMCHTNTFSIQLCNKELVFVEKVKYRGVYLSIASKDDNDINRQIRLLYCHANQSKSLFPQCSLHVKNMLFKLYCSILYALHLWCKYLTIFSCCL